MSVADKLTGMILAELPITFWPSLFSALAAIGSFFTARLVLRIQKQNLIDSVRPELLLDGWSFEVAAGRVPHNWTPGFTYLICSKRLKNVGKGPAFNVRVTAFEVLQPQAWPIKHNPLPVVGCNEERDFNLSLWADLKPESKEHRSYAKIDLVLWYQDAHGRDYSTIYQLVCRPGRSEGDHDTTELADGLKLNSRRSVSGKERPWRNRSPSALDMWPRRKNEPIDDPSVPF